MIYLNKYIKKTKITTNDISNDFNRCHKIKI